MRSALLEVDGVKGVAINFKDKLVMVQADGVSDATLTEIFDGTRFSAEVVAN